MHPEIRIICWSWTSLSIEVHPPPQAKHSFGSATCQTENNDVYNWSNAKCPDVDISNSAHRLNGPIDEFLLLNCDVRKKKKKKKWCQLFHIRTVRVKDGICHTDSKWWDLSFSPRFTAFLVNQKAHPQSFTALVKSSLHSSWRTQATDDRHQQSCHGFYVLLQALRAIASLFPGGGWTVDAPKRS